MYSVVSRVSYQLEVGGGQPPLPPLATRDAPTITQAMRDYEKAGYLRIVSKEPSTEPKPAPQASPAPPPEAPPEPVVETAPKPPAPTEELPEEPPEDPAPSEEPSRGISSPRKGPPGRRK